MPKVSVVVPVYNVKDYLKKCVDSILAQTERDLELLLIDDGSTDGSSGLCEEFSKSDPRVRVIHQENKGLGGARNTGIKAASGDWLLLVDSDDWIEPETLQKALEAGERENADMVMFGLRSVDENGNVLRTVTETVPKDTRLLLEDHKDLLLTAPSAANKLYRRELFTRAAVEFPPRVWYEDIRTTPKLMTFSGPMVFLDYMGYNYFQRTGSIMQNPNIDRNVEILDAFDDLLQWFQKEGLFEKYRDELCFLCWSHIFLTASVRVIRLNRKHPLIPRFAAYVKEKFPDYRHNKYRDRFTWKQRVILSLLEKRLYLPVELIFRIKG